jgi:thioredoxin reductase
MRVESISRQGVDKMKTPGRDDAPFVLGVRDDDGRMHKFHARAVIDASGTWTAPNPLGADGVLAVGEADAAGRIRYGIPDVRGTERQRYAGQRVLVVGSGHSAFNALLDLAALAAEAPATTITWAIRGAPARDLYGGGESDALPARGLLGQRLRRLVETGAIRLVAGFRAEAVRLTDNGIEVLAEDGHIGPVDEIIAATGFRPSLSLTRELRLSLDPTVESPVALAPLIDPNVHSCGTVPPHGFRELSHPEQGFYTVGMKSYGRAPTFLLLTGYEQVRSVVAALAGDLEAAADVRLTLPQTGVCSGPAATDDADHEAPQPFVDSPTRAHPLPVTSTAGCCGGPAPAPSGACCALDAEAKAAGKPGCGCAEEQRGPQLVAVTSGACC